MKLVEQSKPARCNRWQLLAASVIFHHSMSSEEVLKTEFCGVEGKVPDKQFVVHAINLLGLTFCFPGLFPNHRVSNHH